MQDVSSGPANVVMTGGLAHPALTAVVAAELGLTLVPCNIRRFPDGETTLEIRQSDIEGRDVMFVQPTSNVASQHLFELVLAADACHHAAANSISAIVPYFGYARQDRRKHAGEALGARVAAKLLNSARFDHLLTVDMHGETAEAALDIPTENSTAVPLLAAALAQNATRDGVVVAADLGAVRLARKYAAILRLPFAVVQKVRMSATEVAVEAVAGTVRGRRPILVDDIIATGGTLVAAAQALRQQGCVDEMIVAATHATLTSDSLQRLRDAKFRRVLVTDSVPFDSPEFVEVISIAPLLASWVRRISARVLSAQYLSHR